MKWTLPLALVALALAAGCGGSRKAATTTAANPQIASGIGGLPRSASCTANGITTRAAREGTCTVKKTSIVVANRRHSLRMREYSVRLTGMRTAATLGARAAENFEPGGRFVIVELRVQNPGKARISFDRPSRVAYLLVGGQLYPEIPGAEAEVADSFHRTAAVPPGGSRAGTVVFDPPRQQAVSAGARGRAYLVFLNLNEQLSGPPRVGLGKTALGFIRLWK